jgi:regulatory protein
MPTPTCSIPLRVKMAKRYAYKKGGPVGPPFFLQQTLVTLGIMYYKRSVTPVGSVTEAKRKIEAFCAYQERCHKEVEEKLKSMGMIDESIAHIIGHLIEQNYLNEERFTVQFTLGKLRIKSWGLERILRELKLRGISSYNLKKAATVFEEEPYLDIFDQLAQRKIEAVQGLSLETRKKKVFEYLRYRGWSTELIYEKLNAIN